MEQFQNLSFLRRLALSGGPTDAERAQVLAVYDSFRPDHKALQELRAMAEEVAQLAFSAEDPFFLNAARTWSGMSTSRREEVLTRFVSLISEATGIEVNLAFYNSPPEGGRIRHGFYSAATNTVNLNMNSRSAGSYAFALKTAFQEMVHAVYYQPTSQFNTREILELAQSGKLTYGEALAYFNARDGLYFRAADVGELAYQMQPHEQLAYIGQHLWENAAKARGLQDPHVTFAPNHPLATFLRQNGLA
jgi:enoyl-CoA hydratase/carnithine racemase